MIGEPIQVPSMCIYAPQMLFRVGSELKSGNFIMDSTSDLYLYDNSTNIQSLTSYVDYADVSKYENSIILGIPDSSVVSVYDYSSSWSFSI